MPYRFPVWPFACFLSVLLALAGLSYRWVQDLELEAAHRRLEAVADLKQKQIVDWLADLRLDAEILTAHGLLAHAVERWAQDGRSDGESAARIGRRLDTIRKAYGFKSIHLLDAQGKELMSLGEAYPPPKAEEIREAIQGMATHIGDVHADESGAPGAVVIDVVAPLLVRGEDDRDRAVGAMAYHIDLARFLYPLIQSWPIASETAETLLVRQEGENALMLSEPRYLRHAALKLRLPLRLALPGTAGPDSLDYRGVPVLAEIRPIPGTAWFMVAKQDLEEIYRPARQAGATVLSLFALLIAGFSVTFRLWYGRRVAVHALAETRAELQLAALLRQANDIILLMDAEGRILDANARAFQLYGYAKGELIGANARTLLAELAPDGDWQAFWADWRGAAEGPREVVHRRADGSPIPLEVNAVWIDDGDAVYVQAILRDIRERKAAELERRRLNDFYVALSQTSQAIVRIADRDALYREICRIAAVHAHIVVAFVVRPDLDGAMRALASDGPKQDYLQYARIVADAADPDGGGIVGRCWREARPTVCQDAATDPTMLPWRESWQRFGIASGACFPICRQGQIDAVFALYAEAPGYWSEALIDLLEEMADDLSYALDKIAGESERRKLTEILGESERRYRLLFEHMQSGFALHQSVADESGAPSDFRFLAVNAAYARMAGREAAAMVGMRVGEIHPDDAGIRITRYRTVAATGEALQFESFAPDAGRWYDLIAYRPAPEQCAVIVNDITARKQAERQLQLAAGVFASTQEGILIADPEANILEVNPAFVRLTGYAREEALGQNAEILKSDRHDVEFYEALWQILHESGMWSGELWNRKKDGTVHPVWSTVSAVRDEAGHITHFIGTFSDIARLKRHEQQLEYMAYFDPLTGIPNRALLADRMRQAIAQTRRQNCLLAVGYLDLDAFKPINDRLGHAVGDNLLIEISQRIKSALREGDTVARLGGDEFVVLLLGLEQKEECLNLLRRLLAKIGEPATLSDGAGTEHTVSVSASLGVTLFPLDDVDSDALLRHADQAMYQAKQRGKNRFYLYDPKSDARLRARRAALARIERALENREFALFHQPKIDLRAGRAYGVEALIRWRHPERGWVAPGDFLPQIATRPLAERIDRWVMEEALRQLAEWTASGLDLSVSVNVAAQTLQAPDFADNLAALLATRPTVAPARYELEILETAALGDIAYISETMRHCQSLGVRFALDDFGTGYSSLTYLRDLPAEVLKIDQSFVRNMLDNENDLAIVQSVIGLSRAFRRQVIAEGVETVEHGVALLDLGCERVQGFGVSRPLPTEAVPRWLESWKIPQQWR